LDDGATAKGRPAAAPLALPAAVEGTACTNADNLDAPDGTETPDGIKAADGTAADGPALGREDAPPAGTAAANAPRPLLPTTAPERPAGRATAAAVAAATAVGVVVSAAEAPVEGRI
jgi:hypothetical protein